MARRSRIDAQSRAKSDVEEPPSTKAARRNSREGGNASIIGRIGRRLQGEQNGAGRDACQNVWAARMPVISFGSAPVRFVAA